MRLHFLIQNKICIIVVFTVIKKYYITVVRNECEPKNIHNAKNPNGPKISAFIHFFFNRRNRLYKFSFVLNFG